MSTESEMVDAVTGLVIAVPVYQDLAQPAAKELGKSLKTVAEAINVVLFPLNVMIWGYDQIKDFISLSVVEKLKNVSEENIISPKPNIAVPAIEALRYSGDEPLLSDLYANLLASAMNKNTASGVHPAFVEIIKQLTSDEAKLIKLFLAGNEMPLPLLNVRWEYKVPTDEKKGGITILVNFSFLGVQAGLEFPDSTPTYIDNLCRLGIAEVPAAYEYTGKDVYLSLENAPEILSKKYEIERNEEWICVFERKAIRITELGKKFIEICVVGHQTP